MNGMNGMNVMPGMNGMNGMNGMPERPGMNGMPERPGMNGMPETATEPNEIVTLLANFVNYLNVSYYESLFTKKHEDARANINAIYDAVAMTPNVPPTKEQCVSFYNDIRVLENVTHTDDPDYFIYKRLLRKYIASAD
jgi:hypothetical protein